MGRLKTLTKRNLKSWIARHKRGEHVGAIASPCGCPIARFVQSTLPTGQVDSFGSREFDYTVRAMPEYVKIEIFADLEEKVRMYQTPKWVADFIMGVDMGEEYSSRSYINREEALELLSTL